MRSEWRGFKGTHWLEDVNVRDFVQNNYTEYGRTVGDCRSCRRKSVLRAACWIWRPR